MQGDEAAPPQPLSVQLVDGDKPGQWGGEGQVINIIGMSVAAPQQQVEHGDHGAELLHPALGWAETTTLDHLLLLLFEYRTAECKLDWIDLLALMAFHLSLDEDCNIAELLY